jgi:hypothetical protein
MEARCHEDQEDIVDTVTELLEVTHTALKSTYILSQTYSNDITAAESSSGTQPSCGQLCTALQMSHSLCAPTCV